MTTDGDGDGDATRSAADRPGEDDVDDITFEHTTENEARILCDEDWIGGLFRRPDILKPGSHYYVVHFFDDPRGPIRVHDRSRVREATEARAALLPHLQGRPPRCFNADDHRGVMTDKMPQPPSLQHSRGGVS